MRPWSSQERRAASGVLSNADGLHPSLVGSATLTDEGHQLLARERFQEFTIDPDDREDLTAREKQAEVGGEDRDQVDEPEGTQDIVSSTAD